MSDPAHSLSERAFLFIMHSRRRVALVLGAVFASGFLLHWVAERLLVYSHIGRGYHQVVEPALTGATSAAIVYVFVATARERRRRVSAHLQQVAELNHQIRNALDVILLQTAVSAVGAEAVARVTSAVARIDAALRDISPDKDQLLR